MAIVQPGADEKKAEGAGKWLYGLYAVGFGLAGILLALLIVVSQFEAATDVGTVLGVVVAPMATIVAAYFGVQAGAAGKEASDRNAKAANDKAIALASVAERGAAEEALRSLR